MPDTPKLENVERELDLHASRLRARAWQDKAPALCADLLWLADELEAERSKVYSCPQGCGTLIPVPYEGAVELHRAEKEKAEQRAEAAEAKLAEAQELVEDFRVRELDAQRRWVQGQAELAAARERERELREAAQAMLETGDIDDRRKLEAALRDSEVKP